MADVDAAVRLLRVSLYLGREYLSPKDIQVIRDLTPADRRLAVEKAATLSVPKLWAELLEVQDFDDQLFPVQPAYGESPPLVGEPQRGDIRRIRLAAARGDSAWVVLKSDEFRYWLWLEAEKRGKGRVRLSADFYRLADGGLIVVCSDIQEVPGCGLVRVRLVGSGLELPAFLQEEDTAGVSKENSDGEGATGTGDCG